MSCAAHEDCTAKSKGKTEQLNTHRCPDHCTGGQSFTKFYFGRKSALPRQEVRGKLHELVRGFRSRPGRLVLAADPKAPVESLIFLVDEVRMQGGEKLLIATTGQLATDKP